MQRIFLRASAIPRSRGGRRERARIEPDLKQNIVADPKCPGKTGSPCRPGSLYMGRHLQLQVFAKNPRSAPMRQPRSIRFHLALVFLIFFLLVVVLGSFSI